MNERITKLRGELSGADGPAQLPTLLRLGQELTKEYWRAGPGRPAALSDLSSAIEVWDKAYRLLDANDPARGQIAVFLGWLLSTRHGAHGGGPKDRDTGIFVLSEALTFTNLPPTLAAMARLSLGQLFLGRATEALNPAAARAGFLGGLPPDSRKDADEAARLFREIIDGPPLSAEISAAARTLLTLVESIQPLLGGDLARFDLGKIMEALSILQRLQQTGMPSVSWVLGDSLDYPITVMQGAAHLRPTVPPRRPAPAPAVSTDPSSAREAARDRLASLVADPGIPVWEQARALLIAGPSAVAAGDLDAFVGAAANAVDAEEGGEPVEQGLDRLLAATGLCLRQSRDGSGWGDDDEDAIDGTLLAAAAQLLAAAGAVPPDHPAAIVVVEALGGLLDDARPLSGAITEIADTLFSYAEKIPSRPPTVIALAQLCRTVIALRTKAPIDPDAFAAAVPADHPWQHALSTAVGHARLAAAVRAGEPIAVDPALGNRVELLDALLRDDRTALRAALDAASERTSPRTAAVLGAVRLELHDVDAAIPLLSGATRTLDDDGLRTRSWWRLAEAYRKRAAVGDAELSRDAGLNALRGPDPDRRRAARFAGWMLAEGRGMEAFTALEIAAVSPEQPHDLLAQDVVSVITGVSQQVRAAPEVSSTASVAAAAREVGAAALLYLHPTDDAGRTAGVLCLHSATEQLDLLGNVPVTNLLTSDDPGLPAILGRWTAGRLLVAATGGLDRLALAAVRTSTDRRLVQDVAISHVSSGAQLVRLASRPFVPVNASPLFVVNPRGDRDSLMAEVMVVRRLFYPRSACLGRAIESAEAPGTADDLLSRLPDASLLHLACGLHATELQLACDEVLDTTAMRGAGGLVLLSEGSAPFLLDADFVGVVGWQWPVPAPAAALTLFMVHLHLVDHQMPPAAAVNAVQQWLLDPDRILPPFLTGAHLHTVATIDLTQPALWAALTYHGR
ncbi:hypothetical protein ACIBD9_04080 [Micromonospora sp. NPDC050784]|uniref:hypothetical protein n=1 Tax=Micromonospora sp. NPDC050784 TaxID=3364281 RepID=UPI0037B0472C